ncbi:hypothetical protein [Actinoplanes aureus]|uniref:Uncharacterized protein n=1 Tax=Actinoplanes aureus TaxID=2792083 RepID=A0A931CDL8_9ACTN|nr:hypothetical protein [Actinoplanes aureus]MBG0562960.1 hypothetical protein [Actinoplanes aureus]
MRHRIAALTGAVLAGTLVNAGWETPAAADKPGFSVRVDAPGEFTVGSAAKTVTAVVTSQNRQCRKVRWALLVHSEFSPGQMRVTRVEEEPGFPVETTAEGDTTRIVDESLDPGVLCRGRTVTGRWQIEFEGPDAGAVQFEVQALDVRDELLSAGGAAARVEGGEREAEPAPSAEAAPAPEDNRPPAAQESEDAEPSALVSQESTLLGPGLIVGGVFVFLGVLLLLRIRSRAKEARRRAEALPTGFYTMPGAPR